MLMHTSISSASRMHANRQAFVYWKINEYNKEWKLNEHFKSKKPMSQYCIRIDKCIADSVESIPLPSHFI